MNIINFLIGLALLALTMASPGVAFANDSKSEVLTAVHEMWDHASNADVDAMFSKAPDNHTYVMAGHPLWSKQETLGLYGLAFDGVVKQHLKTHKEQVTLLSDTVALYVADMHYSQFDVNGPPLESGPYVITVVLKKVNGHWLNMHSHQSFPATN
ncbi:hypothetical protein AHAT_17910 [Agarivorans sp. Toyoura001]|uniref:nuclear transport factor 2 family protein n=1 Tax=Agarivorans sp. Toyoura001 TaxID=2283141 RepID=UPI0010DB6234|nr:nuclear transport factor 2 family protein [Agarivorans sp. Toyoura001]GDY25901.1 hypothetical protein AHAT_17910 [Agarivorans sp. Toyoura001]